MSFIRLKLAVQYLLPKLFLTIFAGKIAMIETPWIKNYLIQHFIKTYEINMDEALEENINAYPNFNAFFIRHLKPDVRNISNSPLVSPIDGYVSAFGQIESGTLIQAKGHDYTVDALLAAHYISDQHLSQFQEGSFITLYLSPKDYHRVHMPYDGVLHAMHHVPGRLWSVQPLTTEHVPELFAKNERLVSLFKTDLNNSYPSMAMVMVGAIVVGQMGTQLQGDLLRTKQLKQFEVSSYQDKLFQKGDEFGYFKLGSTVVLLFSQPVEWSEAIQVNHPIQLGQALGAFKTGE